MANKQKIIFNSGITKIGNATYFYGFKDAEEYYKENYTLWRFKNTKIYIKNNLGFNIENIKLNEHINFHKHEIITYVFWEKFFIPWIPTELSFNKNYYEIYSNMKITKDSTIIYYQKLIVSIDNDFLNIMNRVNISFNEDEILRVYFEGNKYFTLDVKETREINLSDIDTLQKLLIDRGDFDVYALRCI